MIYWIFAFGRGGAGQGSHAVSASRGAGGTAGQAATPAERAVAQPSKQRHTGSASRKQPHSSASSHTGSASRGAGGTAGQAATPAERAAAQLSKQHHTGRAAQLSKHPHISASSHTGSASRGAGGAAGQAAHKQRHRLALAVCGCLLGCWLSCRSACVRIRLELG
jgi:hypothetical protein